MTVSQKASVSKIPYGFLVSFIPVSDPSILIYRDIVESVLKVETVRSSETLLTTFARLYGVTSWKTTIDIFSAVRTSNHVPRNSFTTLQKEEKRIGHKFSSCSLPYSLVASYLLFNLFSILGIDSVHLQETYF